MDSIAAMITAIMTSLAVCIQGFEIVHKKNRYKVVFHMILQRIYTDYKRKRKILEMILNDEDFSEKLSVVVEKYEKDLYYSYKDIDEAKKYEEICRVDMTEEEMILVNNYIRQLSYFYGLTKNIFVKAESDICLLEYRIFLRNSISEEQCVLFEVNKNMEIDEFYQSCFDRIDKYWKETEQILR